MSAEIDINEKYGWTKGDVLIEKGTWNLGYTSKEGGTALVQTWEDLQAYLLEKDAGASINMKNAFYRFMRHNPKVKYMPDTLRVELQAEGLLP